MRYLFSMGLQNRKGQSFNITTGMEGITQLLKSNFEQSKCKWRHQCHAFERKLFFQHVQTLFESSVGALNPHPKAEKGGAHYAIAKIMHFKKQISSFNLLLVSFDFAVLPICFLGVLFHNSAIIKLWIASYLHV